MERVRVLDGSPIEDRLGFSRAVRVGQTVHVSGSTAFGSTPEDGEDPTYHQARVAIARLEDVLREAGASLADVVLTRVYLASPGTWGGVVRAHAEAFGELKPASTMVEVAGLIDPSILVEVEATAVITSRTEASGDVSRTPATTEESS